MTGKLKTLTSLLAMIVVATGAFAAAGGAIASPDDAYEHAKSGSYEYRDHDGDRDQDASREKAHDEYRDHDSDHNDDLERGEYRDRDRG